MSTKVVKITVTGKDIKFNLQELVRAIEGESVKEIHILKIQ